MGLIGKIFLICMLLMFTVFVIMTLALSFADAWMNMKDKHEERKNKEKNRYE